MGLLELFILAVGLSMDAFAVSICKGLSVGRVRPVHMLTAGLWFGGFQALMPFLGWLLGSQFEALITNIDHWIAFVLLVFIGGNMVRESRSEEEHQDCSFSPAAMLPLALATSIDALAVGVTFAFLRVDIGGGRQDRQCVRREVPLRRGALRRLRAHPHRRKDPAGASWHPGVRSRGLTCSPPCGILSYDIFSTCAGI